MTQPAEQDTPAPGADEAPVRAVPAVPTREQIRADVRAALADGRASVEDVIADMYASQYSAEMGLRSIMATFEQIAGSKIGARLFGKGKKFGAEIERELRAIGSEGEDDQT